MSCDVREQNLLQPTQGINIKCQNGKARHSSAANTARALPGALSSFLPNKT